MKRLCRFLCVVILAGCGGSEGDVQTVEQDYLAVMDREGNRQIIPSDEIIDTSTGEPAARKVLAIDRRSGRTEWIPVDDIYDQPPATARYIPLTHADPDDFAKK